MFLYEIVLFVAVALSSVLITFAALAVVVPFDGALVRHRANYLPKAVSLDNVLQDGQETEPGEYVRQTLMWREQRATAKIGPVVNGVAKMMRRIVRLEGWRGLWKGITLDLVLSMMIMWIQLLLFGSLFLLAPYNGMPAGPDGISKTAVVLYSMILALFDIPIIVLTNRAIVHPRLLNWRYPKACLREIMSHDEQRQPWRLYIVPGVFQAVLLKIFWVSVIGTTVRQLTVPALGVVTVPTPVAPGESQYSGPSSDTLTISPLGLSVFLVWILISAVVVTPIECVIVRLSVQRPAGQQPLHEAYAQVAEYNHQATVPQPQQQQQQHQPRSSFAIDDETAEREREEAAADADADTYTDANADANAATAAPAPRPMQRNASHIPGDLPSEPVIALRPCDDTAEEAQIGFGATPVERYSGVVDCVRKMIDEEGLESLWRGVFFTLIFILMSSL
ncbi:hypothetical protein MCUN1_003439 [Malassezia cuniculi]|uniref:Uncharacterized protein n=1 Tax=Malassezia cuniculi TaxID=948313 RepID=A0AAF0JD51_9BASI|nr:hypothetical protein MCUN1_003439 [Malassezia cuniculi]